MIDSRWLERLRFQHCNNIFVLNNYRTKRKCLICHLDNKYMFDGAMSHCIVASSQFDGIVCHLVEMMRWHRRRTDCLLWLCACTYIFRLFAFISDTAQFGIGERPSITNKPNAHQSPPHAHQMNENKIAPVAEAAAAASTTTSTFPHSKQLVWQNVYGIC